MGLLLIMYLKGLLHVAMIEDKDKKKISVTMYGYIVRLIESKMVNDEADNRSDVGKKLLCAGVKKFQVNSQNTVACVIIAE